MKRQAPKPQLTDYPLSQPQCLLQRISRSLPLVLKGSLAMNHAIALSTVGLMALPVQALHSPEVAPPLSLSFQSGMLKDDSVSSAENEQSHSRANENRQGRQSTSSVPDFSGTGRSSNLTDAVSRGIGCATEADMPLMPIAPVEAGYGGQTIDANPTFCVYIPYNLDANSPVTFAIQSEHTTDQFEKTMTLTAEPGIYGFQLPDSFELALDVEYQWYVMVYCNDSLQQDRPHFTSGWVRRVPLPEGMDVSSLDGLGAVAKSDRFASEILWYDALTVLGEALQANPEDAVTRSAWNDLLRLPSVSLDDYTHSPILSCCEID